MDNNDEGNTDMVVAVRVRPLSSKETQAGCQQCCTVMNNKVITLTLKYTSGNLDMFIILCTSIAPKLMYLKNLRGMSKSGGRRSD